MTEQGTVSMTRTEAEEFMKALDEGMRGCVTNLDAIGRKHWRDSEKAMARIPFVRRHKAFEKLRERIGTAFNLGGY